MTIIRHAKRLQQIPRRDLSRLERAMHAAVPDNRAMFAGELESTRSIILQRIDQEFRFVACLLHTVGAEAREGVLGPVGGFEVQEIGEILIRLCAEKLEERLEKGVDFASGGHGFDALGQGFGDLDAEFLCAGHDPAVRGDGCVRKNGRSKVCRISKVNDG
jgi:hypothetical protein